MAFLDNSGDIILDAVLTDLGRQRLAQGRFQISKFALGDEEINYALYNTSDPRGSAFYDLEILQTPLLEAFTSDQSLMKSKLLIISRDNILYMPIFKVNNKHNDRSPDATLGGFNLLADTVTGTNNNNFTGTHKSGIIHGVRGHEADLCKRISIDQGIDSTDNGMSIAVQLDETLKETSYIVKVDERLLELDAYMGEKNTQMLTPRFIDDDGIATYYIVQTGQGSESAILGDRANITNRLRHQISSNSTPAELDTIGKQEMFKFSSNSTPAELDTIGKQEMFAGPLGNILRLVPRTTTRIQQSSTLFDVLGTSATNFPLTATTNISNYKLIDTTISVTGATTGYSIDVPIRIIKGTF